MNATATETRPDNQWETHLAPELFKFSKENPEIAGRLIACEPVEVKGKIVTEYTLQGDSGKLVTLLSTADLKKKLLASHIGRFVHIKLVGVDSSNTREGESAMMLFEVRSRK